MRRPLTLTTARTALVAAASLAAACSSSNKAGQPIGPVYGLDSGGTGYGLDGGGADVVTDHPPDARGPVDAGADHAMPHDARGHDVTQPVRDAGRESAAREASIDASSSHDTGSDARGPADVTTTPDASACPNGNGSIAILGGTSTLAFATVSKNGAAWVAESFAGASVGARPALVELGTQLLGVFPKSPSGNDVILSTVYTPGGAPPWSAPAAIPALAGSDASATETGAAALAVLGASLELVYEGTNNPPPTYFYHGVYSAGAWGPASDKVGGSVTQDFGPSAPAAAVVGTTLYVAYDGGNGGLYVDTWSPAGGWTGATAIAGAAVGSVPPALLPLSGGSADLLLVFALPTTNDLDYVVHTPGAGAGTWSSPAPVNANALSPAAVSLSPLAGGGAVVVYGGGNSLPYGSTYDPSATPAWTPPVSIDPTSHALPSAPTVAGGVCGVDAVAAIVQSAGVEIVTLKAGVWAPPVLVGGTASMTYATVATF